MMVGAGQRGFNEDKPGNDLSALSRPLTVVAHKRARQVGRVAFRSSHILAHLSRPYESVRRGLTSPFGTGQVGLPGMFVLK
jgi:hypothetical protein